MNEMEKNTNWIYMQKRKHFVNANITKDEKKFQFYYLFTSIFSFSFNDFFIECFFFFGNVEWNFNDELEKKRKEKARWCVHMHYRFYCCGEFPIPFF